MNIIFCILPSPTLVRAKLQNKYIRVQWFRTTKNIFTKATRKENLFYFCGMETEEKQDLLMSEDFSEVENSPLWKEERFIPIELNQEQYESLKRGFSPDWEFRYEPHYINGWHYFSRSGYWVKKFLFEYNQRSGKYLLTQCYSTEREYGRPLLAESLCEGYYEPRIWSIEESRRYWFQYTAEFSPKEYARRKPAKCRKCSQPTIVPIVYGEPTKRDLEKAAQKQIILGGRRFTDYDPDWQCTSCGQLYKKL